ncbi:MAG: DUF6249 domain-containing protein [Pseudomonadota bacterium]
MNLKAFIYALILSFTLSHAVAQDDISTTTDDQTSVTVEVDTVDQGIEEFIATMDGFLGERISGRIKERFDALSEEERAELSAKLADKDVAHIALRHDGSDIPGELIGLAAVVLSLGMPVFIVLIVLWFSYRKRRQRSELIKSFIDAGKDVPEQILDDDTGSNPLRSGLNLVAVGVGLVAAFSIIGVEEAAALGLIPLVLGVFRLIYYYVEVKDKRPQ